MSRVLSVNVGMPKDVAWKGRTVHSGIWKQPVTGPRKVRRLNFEGDGQGDTDGHGGEMRAVLVYQIQSYKYWQQYLGRDDFTYGQFGENLTVDGLADVEVCIGDRYRIGTAEFEVTQPRVTCYRVGLRLGHPDMASLLVAHHRPGFYLRVINDGDVEAGDEIIKTLSGPGELTVAEADALLYLPNRDIDKLRRAVRIAALSPGWQRSFRELLDSAEQGMAGGEAGWSGFRKLRVTDVIAETATVTSIYLADQNGQTLPTSRAGQYVSVRVADGDGPAPVRSYSLSAAPHGDSYRISVKCTPLGRVSCYLQSNMRPGVTIDVAAPRGDFTLDNNANPVLLISAGIGVTPVLAMLHELAAGHSERDVWWIYAARRPDEHPFACESRSLLASLAHAHEHVYYSAIETTTEFGRGRISAGRLSAEKVAGLGVPTASTAYICGPPPFITDMRQALAMVGLDPGRIHTELFGTLPSINPGVADRQPIAPHVPPGPPGSGPLITFARSGVTAPFDDAMGSLLDFAEACDVPTRWSCRTGVCHTCQTPVLAGDFAYSPAPLETPPSGQLLLCVARPKTDLVLSI